MLETVVNTLKAGESFTYAVAGRSKGKLDSILKGISESTGKQANEYTISKDFSSLAVICMWVAFTGEDLSKVPKIIADVADKDSLVKMAKSCKVVLNCVGPYRFGGREVVEACIEGKASSVDISGERDYMESVQRDYDEAAKKNGVYIVGACGFDSIPVSSRYGHSFLD